MIVINVALLSSRNDTEKEFPKLGAVAGKRGVLRRDLIERAMLEPAGVFDSPEEVVTESGLSDAQKIEILRRWEYRAADEAVALEEGMQGEESDLLRRILVALGELAGPLDLEHTPPTKQHGLTRDAVKKRG